MPLMNATSRSAALDAIFGDGRAAGVPSSWSVALFAGDPMEGGVEITGGGYARKTFANSTANWPAASSGAKNSAVIDFGSSTGAWSATATHVALYSGSTAWWSGPLTDDISVTVTGTAATLRITVFWNDGSV